MAKCVNVETVRKPREDLTVIVTEYYCDQCSRELPCEVEWNEDGRGDTIAPIGGDWMYCPYCGAEL